MITGTLPTASSATPGRGSTRFAPLARSRHDRVISGVAGGFGERFGIDPMFVRAALVVLVSAGGAGAVLYLVGWVLSREADEQLSVAVSGRQALAFALVVLGLLIILRELGIWFSGDLTWPLALAAAGSATIWARSGARKRVRRAAPTPTNPVETVLGGPVSLPRVLIGGLLIVAGAGAFLAGTDALRLAALWQVALAVAATTAGAGLMFGPWAWRLVGELAEERRGRIRSEERAEVAAHLHDSVLQTLALIQRTPDPREMTALARAQERELRSWLYGHRGDPERLGAAVEAVAGRLEELHRVQVDVVVVGDAPLDDRLRALVQACNEAITNAARHSGAERVSVYVEVEPEAISAYVTDQGCGFDPRAVPRDRRGIAESIRGRMARHGGNAHIRSEADDGTEVALWLPRGNG